jgi:hypothetical protein
MKAKSRVARMARIVSALLVLVAAVTVAAGGVEALDPFQPFDADRWNSSAIVRVQEVNGDGLLLGIARQGGPFSSTNDLTFPNANGIGTLEATMTLLDIQIPGGSATTANRPRVSLDGLFYWDGTGTGSPTDQTGHVFATIGLAADATAGNTLAQYYMLKCTNASCSTATFITADIVTLGPIAFFEPHHLSVQYDGTNFFFRLDNQTPVAVPAPDGTRLVPTVPFKAVRARVNIPNNATARSGAFALVKDVRVNGAPYEDFKTKTLPRVQILPGSGTYSSRQTFDLVIMVETAGEAVTNVRATVNGADVSSVLPLAIHGTIPSGGVTYRFPGVPATALGLGAPVLIGVEATTASGKSARGFALWNAVTANE